jgi:hypothetical protein
LAYTKQIKQFTCFEDWFAAPFSGCVNAHVWERELAGDFEEIIQQLNPAENICEVTIEALVALPLSDAGARARAHVIADVNRLQKEGAVPTLNIIKCYDRDEVFPFFPTDVYSFHVDYSPLALPTILCTYYGKPSEILAQEDAQQKVLIPEIREALFKLYNGPAEGFEVFLVEHFFNLHYQVKQGAKPVSLGLANMWSLAVASPNAAYLPCIHRAPEEEGVWRLMLIC